MAATADRLFVPGPKPREVWLTLGLSVLLHSVLGVGVILAPRFQVGMSIRVPVSYTVNLVDAPPGGRSSVAREPRAAPPRQPGRPLNRSSGRPPRQPGRPPRRSSRRLRRKDWHRDRRRRMS